MRSDFKIIGVGSPIVDRIARIEDRFLEHVEGAKGGMQLVDSDALERLLEKIPGETTRTPGGSAGNTLFALARMGAATAFLGKTGDCPDGTFYRERFSRLGGDPTRFKIGTTENGQCLSLVTPDGERTLRTNLGAAMTLAPDEVSVADFAGCRHAHIEGYLLFNRDLMRTILDAAREAGCSVSLDLASFEVVNASKSILPKMLQDHVDIVFANEEEARSFTGLNKDYETMTRRLAAMCHIAVVKAGPRGAYVGHKDTVHRIPPLPVEQVVDTTGAGDLWAAGFLYGWSRQRDLRECGRIGSMLGAAVVERSGSVLPESVWKSILERIEIIPCSNSPS